MRISDWSSDVCSSDLFRQGARRSRPGTHRRALRGRRRRRQDRLVGQEEQLLQRSEEHTSELQSLMRISYAVFCLKKKKKQTYHHISKATTYQRQHTNHHNIDNTDYNDTLHSKY